MIAAWALSGRVTHVSFTSRPADVGSITSAALPGRLRPGQVTARSRRLREREILDHGARASAEPRAFHPGSEASSTRRIAPDQRRASSAPGITYARNKNRTCAFTRFSIWCQIGRMLSSLFSVRKTSSTSVSWMYVRQSSSGVLPVRWVSGAGRLRIGPPRAIPPWQPPKKVETFPGLTNLG